MFHPSCVRPAQGKLVEFGTATVCACAEAATAAMPDPGADAPMLRFMLCQAHLAREVPDTPPATCAPDRVTQAPIIDAALKKEAQAAADVSPKAKKKQKKSPPAARAPPSHRRAAVAIKADEADGADDTDGADDAVPVRPHRQAGAASSRKRTVVDDESVPVSPDARGGTEDDDEVPSSPAPRDHALPPSALAGMRLTPPRSTKREQDAAQTSPPSSPRAGVQKPAAVGVTVPLRVSPLFSRASGPTSALHANIARGTKSLITRPRPRVIEEVADEESSGEQGEVARLRARVCVDTPALNARPGWRRRGGGRRRRAGRKGGGGE